MKTRLKKIIWTVLLCVLVLSTILALFQWYYVSSVQQSLAGIRRAMREQGFKTDLADFNFSADAATRARAVALMVFHNPLPMDSDGHQFELLPAMSNDTATVIWRLNPLNNGTNILQWSDLHAMLDTNRGSLDAACHAALSGPIRCDADESRGTDISGSQSTSLLYLSRRLNLRTLLELHDGNPDAAWTNLLAATRLVTAWEPAPVGYSQCFHFTMARAAFAAAWQVLQKGNWPDEQLAALQQEWESANFFTNMMETAAIAYTNDVYACQHLPLPYPLAGFSVSTLVGQTLIDPANALAQLKDRVDDLKDCVPGVIYRHHGVFVDEMGLLLLFQKRALELRRAIQATNWAEMRALPGVINPALYSSSYPPAEDSIQNDHGLDIALPAFMADAEARRRVLITALALERYHGKHGVYPATLAPLAPEFLKTVPVDFMDSQPLRYHLTDDGHFVLYSVGLDCVDDGGILLDPTGPQWIRDFWQNPTAPAKMDIVWPRPAAP